MAIVLITGMVIFLVFVFLQGSTFWEERTHSNDPCYTRIDGKSPVYILKNGRVCSIYAETTQGVSYFKTLEGADVNSFQIFENGTGYAKDKNHVYYSGEIDDRFDVASFEPVGESYYYRDKYRVVYQRTIIAGADPATFTSFSSPYHGKDKNHVYYYEKILAEADPITFQTLSEHDYASDATHVFYTDFFIEGADPKTFRFLRALNFHGYTYDTDQVFANGTWLRNLDAKTFERVENSDYLRDSNSLYYLDKEVVGVDAGAFHTVAVIKKVAPNSFSQGSCGTDGKVVVCSGDILEGEDPKTYFNMTEEEQEMLYR